MNLQLNDIKEDIQRAVKIALEEDIGSGDITAELIPPDQISSAEVLTREDCVLCGTAWFDETFTQLGGIDEIEWLFQDGDEVPANSTLVKLRGNTRRILTGERTALNFLQLLSGTATTSAQYAKLVEGTDIKILDTRKTIPGLRTAQKYAVGVGGCYNHRIGLYDAFLIKENHIAACGGIGAAVEKARELYPDKLVEVEVENPEQFKEAIRCNAEIIMLDNFSEKELKTISHITTNHSQIEISGNIKSSNMNDMLNKKIDRISVGYLTKFLNPIDFSLKIVTSNSM